MKPTTGVVCSRFHEAIELIGSRWTGAVIKTLMHGPTRYATLRAAIPDISDRMLSERLRALEAAGVVVRRVVPESPVRVEYSLTEKGKSLERAMDAIASWAEQWIAPAQSHHDSEREKQSVVPAPDESPRDTSPAHPDWTGKPRIRPKTPA